MVMKILASVLVIVLALILNLALFGVIGPKVVLGYLISGLCCLVVFVIWS